MFSVESNPAGMCSTLSWRQNGPGRTKSKVDLFLLILQMPQFVSLSLLVSGGTLKVIEVGYILRLRCRAVAAKVIPSSWHQFSATTATTATSGTSGTVGKAQAPFLQNYQILRLKICQKIYTTQFSGKTILHTENA